MIQVSVLIGFQLIYFLILVYILVLEPELRLLVLRLHIRFHAFIKTSADYLDAIVNYLLLMVVLYLGS